jgi:hypothetical protein
MFSGLKDAVRSGEPFREVRSATTKGMMDGGGGNSDYVYYYYIYRVDTSNMTFRANMRTFRGPTLGQEERWLLCIFLEGFVCVYNT